MLFVNNSQRLFTIRERVKGKILRCDLAPGNNDVPNNEIISMLKGSFYFKELVKNKVMSIGGKKEAAAAEKKAAEKKAAEKKAAEKKEAAAAEKKEAAAAEKKKKKKKD